MLMRTPKPILVVDDEKNVRLTLAEALAGARYPVDAVASGEEALARLDAREYALVLLDLRLPGMDGLDVLKEIERRRPDVPVVILTAHGTVDAAVTAVKAGARRFMLKPFTVEEIRAVAAEVLDVEAEAAVERKAYEDHVEEARQSLRDGHVTAALQHARSAINFDPTRPEAFNVMGIVSQVSGRIRDAHRYYDTALAIAPSYRPALRNKENMAGVMGKPNLSAFDLGDEEEAAPRRAGRLRRGPA
jgi:DNA-binding response OmpR family regulator